MENLFIDKQFTCCNAAYMHQALTKVRYFNQLIVSHTLDFNLRRHYDDEILFSYRGALKLYQKLRHSGMSSFYTCNDAIVGILILHCSDSQSNGAIRVISLEIVNRG